MVFERLTINPAIMNARNCKKSIRISMECENSRNFNFKRKRVVLQAYFFRRMRLALSEKTWSISAKGFPCCVLTDNNSPLVQVNGFLHHIHYDYVIRRIPHDLFAHFATIDSGVCRSHHEHTNTPQLPSNHTHTVHSIATSSGASCRIVLPPPNSGRTENVLLLHQHTGI